MANYQKHEGKNITDGNNVVILYGMIEPTNPFYSKADYDHCLVYKMGSVSPAYETTMLQYVRSVEGQNARDVGDVLNKYTLSSEYPVSILQYLRNMGKLQLVPVDEIMIVLNSTTAFPLRNWVELEKGKREQTVENQPVVKNFEPTSQEMEVTIDNVDSIQDVQELEAILSVKEEEVRKLKEKLEKMKK